MADSTLSVVTANYNHGALIGRAIEAVMSQSRPPDEYIIVDDGSTDGSVAVIEGYRSRYPVIRFERNPRNLGAIPSIDRAFGLATGDWVYGGAADDYVLPGFFEAAMSMAERHPETGIIFGHITARDDSGRDLETYRACRWDRDQYVSPERFLAEYLEVEAPNHSLSGATVFRRSSLDAVGGYHRELGSWFDTFTIRAVGLAFGACYLDRPCMVWNLQPEGVSSSTGRDPRRMLDIIARAARLMRSDGYRKLFPESHVAGWERAYRALVISDARRELERRRAAADAGWTRLASAVLGWRLRRYRPDRSGEGG